MDKIQAFLITAGHKDLAQDYFLRFSSRAGWKIIENFFNEKNKNEELDNLVIEFSKLSVNEREKAAEWFVSAKHTQYHRAFEKIRKEYPKQFSEMAKLVNVKKFFTENLDSIIEVPEEFSIFIFSLTNMGDKIVKRLKINKIDTKNINKIDEKTLDIMASVIWNDQKDTIDLFIDSSKIKNDVLKLIKNGIKDDEAGFLEYINGEEEE